jgi:hypothetical protein
VANFEKSKFDSVTIEPDGDGGWDVYGHGVYPRSSVLAGHPKRNYLEAFKTLDEAVSKYPSADRLDHSTKVQANPMSDSAPGWFDPTYAGEVWGEEDY